MDRALQPLYEAQCLRCGARYNPSTTLFRCPECGEPLELVMKVDTIDIDWKRIRERPLYVWRYRELLPPVRNPVTMFEGGTPLIDLGEGSRVFVKFEGANPTGSFKDRGMTVGISIAREAGFRAVIVASTGNTSASAAAYAARAGMKCFVVLPIGSVAKGKLAQAVLHGATILGVEGVFDKALEHVIESLTELIRLGVYLLNSLNPWRLEGQKTLAFEVYDQLGIPDWVVVPVGNAGNIYAIWKGFDELKRLGLVDRVPRMVGVQAAGAAPLYRTWVESRQELARVESPSTVATAIKIGNPVNWLKALKAVRESRGLFTAVDDNEILEAHRALAKRGIGVEPASAAAYAGYLKLVDEGVIDRSDTVVIVATGHALKDPDTASRGLEITRVSGVEQLVDMIRRASEN